MKLLIKNVKELVQVVNAGQLHLLSRDIQENFIVSKGVSVSVDESGLICQIGNLKDILAEHPESEFERVIDGKDLCVIPGLVDAHTHPVWAGDRVHEFGMKMRGATYMEIHKAGGGIGSTVRATRSASEGELLDLFVDRLRVMGKHGTTLVECKSGYGLDTETEVKMLKVIEKAKRIQPVELSTTFCGAHSVPAGSTEQEAVTDVIDAQIPKIAQLQEQGTVKVDSIDVFCEKGVFGVESTKKILSAGKKHSWMINFHAEELSYLGGVEMGVELGSRAISHLEEVSSVGMDMMAQAGTVAVVLPTTALILQLKPPPVRTMLDKGVIVALGTDFNPNAYCVSMLTAMNLACVTFRMSLEEALVAATLNSAASLNRSHSHGSIEVGKVGDFVMFNVATWQHVIYNMMATDHISFVVKKGCVIRET